MVNDYINFYGKNKISPVNQDISDFEIHLRRRQKLYRQCGIPTVAFKNADMLEVGPGGGHNALAPIEWGVSHIDLVEPNPTGVMTIRELFDSRMISNDKYSIFDVQLEEFVTDKEYDIVVAESFIQYVPNAREICRKLMKLVARGGVVVITCADDVCMFVEIIKRLAGQYVAGDEGSVEEKVNKLIPVFEPQLKSLRGVSRPTRDWIYDNIFNPATVNGCSFSMADAIDCFENFDLIGCSPRLFTDYSWYKDIWHDEKTDCKYQFDRKRMSLVLAGIAEQLLEADSSIKLSRELSDIKRIEEQYEELRDINLLIEIRDRLCSCQSLVKEVMCEEFYIVYEDIVDLLKQMSEGKEIDMIKYPNLSKAFGRGQQYMSFMRV